MKNSIDASASRLAHLLLFSMTHQPLPLPLLPLTPAGGRGRRLATTATVHVSVRAPLSSLGFVTAGEFLSFVSERVVDDPGDLSDAVQAECFCFVRIDSATVAYREDRAYPTLAPSDAPTPAPSPLPTTVPFSGPTATPTPPPSQTPTLLPKPVPTALPTIVVSYHKRGVVCSGKRAYFIPKPRQHSSPLFFCTRKTHH